MINNKLKKINIYQIMYVLHEFIMRADSKGDYAIEVDDNEDSLYRLLEEDMDLCSYLHQLELENIISFYEGGEDGWRPSFFGSISLKTHQYLAKLIKNAENEKKQEIQELEEKISNLNNRIKEIFSFDPIKLSNNLEVAQADMNKISEMIKENKTLEPLNLPLDDIRKHYASIKTVSDMYEDVYKNIIRPVENAGKSGVRETVRWAIIAMIFSVVSSLLINNFSAIKKLIENNTTEQVVSKSDKVKNITMKKIQQNFGEK